MYIFFNCFACIAFPEIYYSFFLITGYGEKGLYDIFKQLRNQKNYPLQNFKDDTLSNKLSFVKYELNIKS